MSSSPLVLGHNLFLFGTFTEEETRRLLAKQEGTLAVDEEPVEDDLVLIEETAFTAKAMVKNLASLCARETKDQALSQSRGLYNLGNTCFVNVVLQCILLNQSLRRIWVTVLQQAEFLQQIGRQDCLDCFPVLLELSILAIQVLGKPELIQQYVPGTAIQNAVSPDRFVHRIRPFFARQGYGDLVSVNQASDTFSVRVTAPQQDAHEFLEWLLDTLQEEQVKLAKLGTDASGSAEEEPDSEDEWQEVGQKGRAAAAATKVGNLGQGGDNINTFISTVFQGTFRSSVRKTGTKESVTLQPFMCLQLDVLNSKVKTVDDALELFMSPELLTGLRLENDDPVGRSPTPPLTQRGQKHLMFDTLPQVLILHLKRFVYDQNTGHPRKLRKLIKYPMRLVIPEAFLGRSLKRSLRMDLDTAESDDSSPTPWGQKTSGNIPEFMRDYELHNIVLHLGPAAVSGHYISISLEENSNGGKWIEHNDSKARNLTRAEALDNTDAYILVYHRKDLKK